MALGLTAAALGLASPSAHAAGGDTFATATLISTLGYTDNGTTIGFANDVATLPSGIGSPYTQVAGPDVFYRLNVVTAGTLTFTVTPTGATGYDPAIYLTSAPSATSAFIARDTNIFNVAETFTTGTLSAGTYFFGIDSFYSTTSTTPARSQGRLYLERSGTAGLGPTAAAPEPGTFALAATGALTGLTLRRRRGAKVAPRNWMRRRGGRG